MSADYNKLATTGLKGLKAVGWYAKTLSLNMLRRGLILSRYTLACWQKQRVNKAMRRVGEEFSGPWSRARPTLWWSAP